MGCCNNPNYQSRAARESINRSAYEACQCADQACECKDLAEQYAQNAEDTWNDFQTRYLGAYSVAPVTSTTGALYFNTVDNVFYVWNGLIWTNFYLFGTAYLANNQTFTGQNIFSVNTSTDAVRITQEGLGNAFVVEDSTNPDSTPFVVSPNGNVGIGTTAPSYKVDIIANTNGVIGTRTVNQNSLSNAQTIIQIGNDTNNAAAAIRLNSSTNTSFGGANALSLINGLSAPVLIATSGIERVNVKPLGQVRFVPLASAPAGPEAGDVYYDSSTNKLRCYNGTIWNDLF